MRLFLCTFSLSVSVFRFALMLLITGMTVPAAAMRIESDNLVIRSVGEGMSPADFEALARQVEATLEQVRSFWSADPMIRTSGKILVELDASDVKADYSFFFFRPEQGRRIRVVRVAVGASGKPHQLAHKLTSALFPNSDKLIRNMMGEASELRFGNIESFPMCGHSTDYWVSALVQTGAYTPLDRLGSDHGDWGMFIVNNVPRVQDRAKQHASYIEAGSFGDFLVRKYGAERLKRFHQTSLASPRPWQAVYGISLEQLEAEWLADLNDKAEKGKGVVATMAKWLTTDPAAACFEARRYQFAK
jgi:hypothetical protein